MRYIIVIAILAGFIYISDMRIQYVDKLGQVQDCVVELANEHGYTGNPYGQEAWDMFAPYCGAWGCNVSQSVVVQAYKEGKKVWCNGGDYWVK